MEENMFPYMSKFNNLFSEERLTTTGVMNMDASEDMHTTMLPVKTVCTNMFMFMKRDEIMVWTRGKKAFGAVDKTKSVHVIHYMFMDMFCSDLIPIAFKNSIYETIKINYTKKHWYTYWERNLVKSRVLCPTLDRDRQLITCRNKNSLEELDGAQKKIKRMSRGLHKYKNRIRSHDMESEAGTD